MSIQSGLVSVVIINFNSGRFLERCFAALAAQTYRPVEIIVVDNGSTDGSVDFLRQRATEGRLSLYEGSNVGSSCANNRGIRESRGEFVLVLNADAFPEPEYLRKCVDAFREDEGVGTVTGKLVSDVDHSIIDSAGLYFYREGLAIDRGFGEGDRGQYDRREFVDGACCAAAVYRRAMLDDIAVNGEFYNESFFAFVEDAELSFRSSMRGWRTLYIPDAVAFHVRGGSSQKLSEFTYYLNERNTRLFLHESYNPVARKSDKLLQRIILFVRSLQALQRLSSASRRRMRTELKQAMAAKMGRNEGPSVPERASDFVVRGRASYFVAALARRLGFRQQRSLHCPEGQGTAGRDGMAEDPIQVRIEK